MPQAYLAFQQAPATAAAQALTNQASSIQAAAEAYRDSSVAAVVDNAPVDRRTFGKLATLWAAAWGYTTSAAGIAAAMATSFATNVQAAGFSVQDVLNQMEWTYPSASSARAGGLNVPSGVIKVKFQGWSEPNDPCPSHVYVQIAGPGTTSALASGTTPKAYQFLSNGGTRLWEIAEHVVYPEHFGAPVNGVADDAPALQIAINLMRDKASNGGGNMPVRAEMLGRRYTVLSPLDMTSTGAKYNFSLRGRGVAETYVYSNLSVGYPVLDASGVAGLYLDGFTLISAATCQSSCAVLMGRDVAATFSNDSPVLKNLLLQSLGPKSAAALIVHDCDQLLMQNVTTQGNGLGPDFVCGGFPFAQHYGAIQAATSSTVTLDVGASSADGAYVGYNAYIASGTGFGQVATITGYDPATKVATISGSWGAALDTTSVVAVMAFRSAFINPGSQFDATKYTMIDCSHNAMLCTGVSRLSLHDTYLGLTGPGPKANFTFDSPGGASITTTLSGTLRCENQTFTAPRGNISCISVLNGNLDIDLKGELSQGGIPGLTVTAPVFSCTAPGTIVGLDFVGSFDGFNTLFNIPNTMIHCGVRGNFRYLGTVSANYSNIQPWPGYFQGQYDTCAAAFATGFYNGVMIMPRFQPRQGVSADLNFRQVYSPEPLYATAIYPTTGGNTHQKRARWTIPANSLTGFDYKDVDRKVDFKVKGYISGSGKIGVQMLNGSNASCERSLHIASQSKLFSIEIEIDTVQSEIYVVITDSAAGRAAFIDPFTYDPTRDIYLDFYETASAADVLVFSSARCFIG